jgi:hypothetical protein
MAAKLEWLNHYVAVSGQWTAGQPWVLESWNDVSFSAANGRDLRIHETDRSGSVLLSPVGGPLMGYGDAEVFLTVFFASPPGGPGGFEYRSAPLHTPIRVDNVSTLRLSLLIPVGNPACASVDYTAFVNGHCIFERL